jgi:hypothetical protein
VALRKTLLTHSERLCLLARASREYNFSSSSVNRIGVILECRFSLAIFGLPGFLFFGFGTHELLPPLVVSQLETRATLQRAVSLEYRLARASRRKGGRQFIAR